ncbi:DUF7310 family coiled-coil domain-containing protein [Candidatus Halobonum tyrrellensis]|uniref:DUF7310 domain-containing protein n=1 Tax=Candidatus Halobonum tyrrellensis G22 TaxID=1324957 RepID=V4HAM7_9EURY|nr:hypothetical protein [Candidatus Halobonum tyrrellensis]ESP87760.1 hypothetical protein K933_12226 [Candidatus Halobonum tyrrellensis G22]
MSDDPTVETAALAERLAAVERAVGDGAAAPADPDDAADVEARLAEVESTLAALDDRVSELEAATQALRGYVGGVRAVNRDVERRADLALARTEELVDSADTNPERDASAAPAAPAAPAADPPDDPDAFDALTPDDGTLAAASDGTTGGDDGEAARGDDEAGSTPAGIAERLRDAL